MFAVVCVKSRGMFMCSSATFCILIRYVFRTGTCIGCRNRSWVCFHAVDAPGTFIESGKSRTSRSTSVGGGRDGEGCDAHARRPDSCVDAVGMGGNLDSSFLRYRCSCTPHVLQYHQRWQPCLSERRAFNVVPVQRCSPTEADL